MARASVMELVIPAQSGQTFASTIKGFYRCSFPMLGQFSSELLALYPSANILAASKGDFEKDKRRELMSRIATGNWDAIIVTHSGFEKIPLFEKRRTDFFQHQRDDLEAAM